MAIEGRVNWLIERLDVGGEGEIPRWVCVRMFDYVVGDAIPPEVVAQWGWWREGEPSWVMRLIRVYDYSDADGGSVPVFGIDVSRDPG